MQLSNVTIEAFILTIDPILSPNFQTCATCQLACCQSGSGFSGRVRAGVGLRF